MRRGPGDLHAAGAVRAVAAGEATAEGLLDDACTRAAAWEPDLGAVVTEVRRLRPGAQTAGRPLHGAVLGIKDLMAVAGTPRLLGAPELAEPAPRADDAVAVARLADAGASIAFTLQTHPLAFGIITPQTGNPRAPGKVAGGSTGGVAAALAAGFIHGGLGTDTGGSVRIPAACCGVVGLKTTRGRVPLTGVADLAWSLDTVGPLAATVADVVTAARRHHGLRRSGPGQRAPRGPAAPRSRRTPTGRHPRPGRDRADG
jgi:aspartyl-tRNA(Asn)/glutamyl-tRNA(Gln) amidotransferase subunit A